MLQTEAAECGLACLAMVAARTACTPICHACAALFAVAQGRHAGRPGAHGRRQLQLNARALRAEMEQIDQLQLPCVLHWDLNHFVVLVAKSSRGHVLIHDPARGVRRCRWTRCRATSPAWCWS
jgi:ATP-binding cassette subfamily B protein RaxB